MTIINRILTTVLFSIYHLLLLRLLNRVMSVLLPVLNSYWIGLDWIVRDTANYLDVYISCAIGVSDLNSRHTALPNLK